MLTAEELVGMREALDESLPDEADIWREVQADDGQGGTTQVPTVQNDVPVPCRVSPIQGIRSTERLVASQLISESLWTLEMPHQTDVRMEDRIEVTSTEFGWVKTFDVIGPMDPRTYEIGTRMICSLRV